MEKTSTLRFCSAATLHDNLCGVVGGGRWLQMAFLCRVVSRKCRLFDDTSRRVCWKMKREIEISESSMELQSEQLTVSLPLLSWSCMRYLSMDQTPALLMLSHYMPTSRSSQILPLIGFFYLNQFVQSCLSTVMFNRSMQLSDPLFQGQKESQIGKCYLS
jgi:hypothetical protein